MVHRFLERWEGGIRQLVPLAYLLSLIAGTIAVFAGVYVQGRLAVAFILGTAIELHTWLMQRQTRADYAAWRTERSASASAKLRASVIPLVVMLALQAVCSYVYTSATYRPVNDVLPRQLLVLGISILVPGLSLLAGFLIPIESNPAELLTASSRAMLYRTMRSVQKQWAHRLKDAQVNGANLAPVARALLEDAGATKDAQRLGIMDSAIPGGRKPTPPGKPTKPRKRRQPAKNSRSELDAKREERLAVLRGELKRTGKLTLNRAQELTGMSNRQGVQMLWRQVKSERAG